MPGVYAVTVKQKNSNKSLKAIANLGYRPTFNQKKILLEVHIFIFLEIFIISIYQLSSQNLLEKKKIQKR